VLSNMVMHTLSFLLIPKGWIILDPNTLEKWHYMVVSEASR
jgi:hypothetical protein